MGISAHVAPKEAMMNRWVGVLWADVGWEHLGMSMKVTKTTSGVTPFTVCRERREKTQINKSNVTTDTVK